VLLQSLFINTYSLVIHGLEDADAVIEPDMAHVSAGDFHQMEFCINQGIEAAESAIAEIKTIMKIR